MTQASLARRAARRGGRRGPPEPGGRYGVLLLVLISTYLLSAFSLSTLAADLEIALFAAVLLLALRTARIRRLWARLAVGVALTGSAAAVVAAQTAGEAGEGAAATWKGLMLLITAVLIVRRVLARPTVTVQSIYGALSAYLIIGLMFAASYAAIWHLGGGPFFASRQPANTQTFQYFSFTTLTTLGYGDFTAISNSGRAIAVMEALAGQVFLATLVARLVAAFRAPAEPARLARPVSRRRWPPSTVRSAPETTRRKIPARNTSRTPSRARELPERRPRP